MNKMILGSAQFGMDYGVSNKIGKINNQEIRNIFHFSQQNNIDTVDTAMSYGNSEHLIGIYNKNLKVITKLPPMPSKCNDVEDWFNNEINQSLERLRLKSLYGILLHNPDDLLGKNGFKLSNLLTSYKKKGIVKKIGLSIYDFLYIHRYLDVIEVDIIQCPFNIIDQRVTNTGLANEMHDLGIEIHSRSIFLQGLLLMPEHERPKYFHKWSSLWSKYDAFLDSSNITPIQACIGFILSNTLIDKFIVGIDSLSHLKEIVELTKHSSINMDLNYSNLSSNDSGLINPSLWSLD